MLGYVVDKHEVAKWFKDKKGRIVPENGTRDVWLLFNYARARSFSTPPHTCIVRRDDKPREMDWAHCIVLWSSKFHKKVAREEAMQSDMAVKLREFMRADEEPKEYQVVLWE